MKVAFVTNFASHYRVQTFNTLARRHSVKFLFFSGGKEWYWQHQHGTHTGEFDHEYLPGVSLGRTRITPSLVPKLIGGDYDVVLKCINGRFALPAAYLSARLRRRPFVLWTGIWCNLGTRFHRVASILTHYIYRHADAVVVYGEHVKRFLVSEGIAAERVFVAAHAVDNAVYSRRIPSEETDTLRAQLGIPKGTPVVLYLGRLEAEKGLGYLIEAFALRDSGAFLVLAGSGSEQRDLARRALEAGIADRVKFAGYVPVQQAGVYYAMATLFVLPSITAPTGKEAWGLVVNEAFNQGLPVVATDAVGAAAGGLVQDGVNGFVVPERDSTALAAAIHRVLADAELRARLSAAAVDSIAGWTNERMVDGFCDAIEFACRARRAACA
jgi:glycosyltransferase involved in cell wall biosynthesis